jgi:hypothetical protein
VPVRSTSPYLLAGLIGRYAPENRHRVLCVKALSYFFGAPGQMVYGDLTSGADVKPARRAGETRHRAARTKAAGCAALHPPYDDQFNPNEAMRQPARRRRASKPRRHGEHGGKTIAIPTIYLGAELHSFVDEAERGARQSCIELAPQKSSYPGLSRASTSSKSGAGA